ncbi:4-phosphoerythronate dehydrogenase PdxB [Beggiatoa leptomitoformis]|uniref:Erythronate-4-phosphate dehydrogenase n=1 Tax=Beggiatoa leptomitoformis TaxID=288004 RepID=A0A2N9YDW2_9GAMM|nr:4-phosphoerythronate dehydrogenase PdxB [Beggiatoa leptomitoformis]ALG69052.1 4-phosphoerythronate dehydrogenase PdxB [Beggiatoa leptomitoformis]AUI68539.1 4-phosphoerythronate dehydrogenase PdxB [Beggiatoa leptomitoformis]
MKILADENIPYVHEAFSTLGEVQTIAGRTLKQADLIASKADVLLVRSVTRVNKTLLADTRVQFVGTTTIGVDHVDTTYLQQQSIGFANAPGSNATSAAEYVISALIILAQQQGFQLTQKTVGIVGCGNVGSRVLAKLNALGVTCLVCDPPLQARTGNESYVSMAEIAQADIITLHVPLITTGYYPTWQLIDSHFLRQLNPNVILINTSRGDVVDETALIQRLVKYPLMNAVLDVWEKEPVINQLLLQRVALGTPHIAGYSFDGKVRGTEMIYTAVCQYFEQNQTWFAQQSMPASALLSLKFSDTAQDNQIIHTAVSNVYDVRRDSDALRRGIYADDPSEYFDVLRQQYPIRREFACVTISLPATKACLASQLRDLGFQVVIN